MPTPWQPGHRRRPSGIAGTYARDMFLLARQGSQTLMGKVFTPEEDSQDFDEDNMPIEVGSNVMLEIFNTRGKRYILSLSFFTEEELNNFSACINEIIETARPICQLRDRKALEAAQHGNDISLRRNRPGPTVLRFARTVSTDVTQLPDGHQDDVSGDESGTDSSDGSGNDLRKMAEYIKEHQGGQDGGPA